MRYWATCLFLLFLDVASFAQSYTITTYAGPGFPANGTLATTQAIDFPYGVVSDGNGGFYVSSFAPNRIYRVGADGRIALVAGAGIPGFSGDGALAVSAQINGPMGLARDGYGNLYFADSGNNRVRQIAPNGIINTVAGTSVAGFSGDGGPAAAAQLRTPRSVAIDPSGNLFIADASNARIRKIDTAGTISTVAGIGVTGFAGDGGPAINAQIGTTEGIAVDNAGNLFIAEPGNSRVREVTVDGIIHTIAGTGTQGFSGDGGPATSAQFNQPYGIAIDTSGNVFISDLNNGRIRQIDPTGIISTVAGSATRGFAGDGGPATSAQMVSPYRVALDEAGNLLIADGSNHRVRKVSTAGIITTAAGNGTAGFSGDGGPATSAQFNAPYAAAFDLRGNLQVADFNNNRIRTINSSGVISTLTAQLRNPADVMVDPSGNLLIADSINYRIQKITPAGVTTTVAGRGTSGFSGDNGAATAAQFNRPIGLAQDAAGNLYIADLANQRIRKVTPGGTISTVAGNGTAGLSGDGGPATSAQLNNPFAIAIDASGNLLIADTSNNSIRKVTSDGIINTIVGSGGVAGFSGDGGQALYAQLNGPAGLVIDAAGNLFIADTNNNRIRMVNLAGTITTVAGTGSGGFRGDGGPATSAWLSQPRHLAVDAAGNVFISDTATHRIRELIPVKQPSVTFSISDGGGISFQTGGTPPVAGAGYAHVVPNAGAPSSSGFAIFSLHQNNVLVSEASVPGSSLMQSGRIYAEINSTVNTGIAIANPNNQTATISFFFTDSNGDFGAGSTTIPANGQIAAFLNQAPFNGRSSVAGTFTFNSSIPVAPLALRGLINERSEFLLTTLSVTDLTAAASSAPVILPHFAAGGGWTTQIVLVNPTDRTLNGTVEFRDPSGQVVTSVVGPFNNSAYSIPPRSSVKLQTTGGSSAIVTGSVHILPATTTAAPSGLTIFSFQNRGVTVSEAGIPAQRAGLAFDVFTESFGDFDRAGAGSTRTGLAIANTSPQPTTVVVEVRNLDGSSGLIGTIGIPANGQASLFLNQIPGIESLITPFRGMLRLTSFTSITVAGIRARYNERSDLLITTTPPGNESVAAPSSGIYFPHFVDGGGYTTQFILFSGQPGQAPSGTLQFNSQSGGAANLVIRQ